MPTCLYESAPSSLGRYRRQGRGGLQAERHGRPPDGKPLNAAAGPNAADFANNIRRFWLCSRYLWNLCMLASMRGDPAMDGVSFDPWLDAIRLLTAHQRQEGFMCLA